MERHARLEACARDLAAAAAVLSRQAAYCDSVDGENSSIDGSIYTTTTTTPPLSLASADASEDVQRARRTVVAAGLELHRLTQEPADFLQNLAVQNQLLAALKWLTRFQVLACIPVTGLVPLDDVAELAGVSEVQLQRVVQLTATAGFLQLHKSGEVMHTPLSKQFVTTPAFLDAGSFLAEVLMPSALQMSSVTLSGPAAPARDSAYNVAFNTTTDFVDAQKHQPKLQRQWRAYRQYAAADVDANIRDAILRLNWTGLSQGLVVDANASNTLLVESLGKRYPALHFVVQTNELTIGLNPTNGSASQWPLTPSSQQTWSVRSELVDDDRRSMSSDMQVTVLKRDIGAVQIIRDARVYILRVPLIDFNNTSQTVLRQLALELQAHIGVLRANSLATLILAASALPEPGAVAPAVEAAACAHQLALHQLANEPGLSISQILGVLDTARDGTGKLMLVSKIHSRQSSTVILEIRYSADVALSNVQSEF